MDRKLFNKVVTRYRGDLSVINSRPVTEDELKDIDLELFEERAAIIQFDAGLDRIVAERQALNDWSVALSVPSKRAHVVSDSFIENTVKSRLQHLKELAQKSKVVSSKNKKIDYLKIEIGNFEDMGIPF